MNKKISYFHSEYTRNLPQNYGFICTVQYFETFFAILRQLVEWTEALRLFECCVIVMLILWCCPSTWHSTSSVRAPDRSSLHSDRQLVASNVLQVYTMLMYLGHKV